MRQVLLIARHEFVETVKQPAFIASIVIFFVSVAAGIIIPSVVQQKMTGQSAVGLVDTAGGQAAALTKALMRPQTIDDIGRLNVYVRNNLALRYQNGGAEAAAVPEIYLREPIEIGDAEVAKFSAAGGRDGYLAAAQPYLALGAPPPPAARTRLEVFDLSRAAVDFGDDEAAVATQLLTGPLQGSAKHLDALVVISPEGADTAVSAITLWSRGPLNPDLAALLRAGVGRAVAEASARARGDWDAVERYRNTQPRIYFRALSRPGERHARFDALAWLIEKLPLGLVVIIQLVVMVQSLMLLTNTMEEKSNRIVEIMLSSVTPGQFMAGKLLGPLAITIFFFLILATIGGLAAIALSGAVGIGTTAPGAVQVDLRNELIAPLIAGLLPKVPAFILFLVLAYLTYAGLFLAVGAFCTNLRQVQALSTPLTLAMLAMVAISVVAASEPASHLAQVLSWLPPTAPFVMVGRLGSGIPWWEFTGVVALQIATIYGVMRLSGRLFRYAALKSDGLPSIGELRALVRRPPA